MNVLSFDALGFCDYTKYGKSYEKAVINLISLLKEADRENFEEYMEEFSLKYTMLPEFWLFWAKNIYLPPGRRTYGRIHQEKLSKIVVKGFKHFKTDVLLKTCLNRNLKKRLGIYKSMHLSCLDSIPNARSLLVTPHKMLRYFYAICLEMSDCAIDARIQNLLKKSIDLYKKLEAEEDNEKWFELLKECNDKECIEQNVEFRIGKYPSDIKLWKLYLNYLKENDLEEMLFVYRRYCRLFLNDHHMRNEYFNEINQYMEKSRVKWWMDVIDIQHIAKFDKSAIVLMNTILVNELKTKLIFCCDDTNNLSTCLQTFKQWAINNENQRMASYLIKCITIPTPLLPPQYTFQKPYCQSFALPYYMMIKILNVQNYIVLQNLFMTCKYFFSKRPLLICHKFVVNANQLCDRKYNQQSLYLLHEMWNSVNYSNLCFTNAIDFCCQNAYALSNILSKIRLCTVKYLDILHQNFSLQEWKFITAEGNIIRCFLNFCKIVNGANGVVPFEEVVKHLPNVSQLHVVPCPEDKLSFYTSHTSKIFVNSQLKKKLEYFHLEFLPPILDAHDVGIFIWTHAAPHSSFVFNFDINVTQEYKKHFCTIAENCLSKWLPESTKPTLRNLWFFGRKPYISD